MGMFAPNPPVDDFKPTTPIDFSARWQAVLIPAGAFLTGCDDGTYDARSGYGHPCTKTHEDKRHDVYANKAREQMPTTATHIHWFST